MLITARVRSTTGRLCFDTCLSVCSQRGVRSSQLGGGQVQPGGVRSSRGGSGPAGQGGGRSGPAGGGGSGPAGRGGVSQDRTT